MRPLYYLPGATSAMQNQLKERLEAAGLIPVLGDVLDQLQPNQLEHGPDKGKGLLVIHAGPGTCGQYKPALQEWVEIKPKGFWIGWMKEHPPTEADLRRERVYEDYKIKLADGREWSIMAITPYRRFGEIPRVSVLGDDFGWRWAPDPKYDALVKKFSAAWETPPQTHDEYAELAVEALQVNYRVDKWLLMCCRLLPTGACYTIVEGALDQPEVLKWFEAKKKEEQQSGDSSSTPGVPTPAASPDLPQLLPT